MKLKAVCVFISLLMGVCSCAPTKSSSCVKDRDELAAEYMAMPEYAAIKLSPLLRNQIIFTLGTAWHDFEIHDGKYLWVDYDGHPLHSEMSLKLSDTMIPKIMEIAKNCSGSKMQAHVYRPQIELTCEEKE